MERPNHLFLLIIQLLLQGQVVCFPPLDLYSGLFGDDFRFGDELGCFLARWSSSDDIVGTHILQLHLSRSLKPVYVL